MNTTLRVLVIVITLLTAAALVFAVLNFNKRQILLGRNSQLVELVMGIAKTVEAQDVQKSEEPLRAMKDIGDVTDRVSATLDTKNVLDDYPAHLEAQNNTPLDYGPQAKQDQLNAYYAMDEATGKPKVNSSTGQKMVKGPGTAQELLDNLLDRAKAQHATLNNTRQQMSKLRGLVEDGVEEINKLKKDGRDTKADLTARKAEIVDLKEEKSKLETNVARLESDKKELQSEVADLNDKTERLEEKALADAEELQKRQNEIERLRAEKGPTAKPGDLPTDIIMAAGDKGKVVEANDEFKFALIEFSPDAMKEMLGANRDKKLPQMDMNVRRTGRASATGEFVTRVKLRHVVRDKNLVVADILTDWQQTSVEKGDVVFFN